MNKHRASRSFLLCAAVLIGGLGVACSDDGDDAVDTEDTSADESTSTTGADAATGVEPAEGDQRVAIVNYEFDPDALTVKVGTKVTWTNADGFDHTATSDDDAPAAFDTGELGTDAAGEFTFTEPGTYAYHCAIHDYMKGTVDVVE
jgi:plastocyanin